MEIIYIKKALPYFKKNTSDYLSINGLIYIWIANLIYTSDNDSHSIIDFNDEHS